MALKKAIPRLQTNMKFKLLITALSMGMLLLFSCSDDDENLPDTRNIDVSEPPEGKDWIYTSTSTSLDLPVYFPNASRSSVREEVFQLGRHLFYEPRLSRNNTVSCGSCHEQSKAFTDGRAFSIGLDGETTRRSSMAVFNLLWDNKFFWDGRSDSLEQQALLPIEDHIEMDLPLAQAVERLQSLDLYDSLFYFAFGDTLVTASKIAEAITEFEIGIVSKDSKFDKFKRGELNLDPDEREGLDLMRHPGPYQVPDFGTLYLRGGNCSDCHSGILFRGAPGVGFAANNGLDKEENWTDLGLYEVTGDEDDKAQFKIPTLRNIELTGPYMHDGRFQTLEEVLDHYNEHVKLSPTTSGLMQVNNNEFTEFTLSSDGERFLLGLTQDEKDKIIAFLKTLTDNDLVTNPRYSNPFLQ